MSKKGQIAIFVIAAVIIIALVVAGFYFRESLFSSSSNPVVVDVNKYVQTCLDNAAKGAVFAMGEQGGYFDAPKISSNISFFARPYYMIDSQNLVPKKETVEAEMVKYAVASFNLCVGNYSAVQKGGVLIKSSSPKIFATISNDFVSFNMNVPISITSGDKSYVLSEFKSKVAPVKLNDLLDAANEIVISSINNPKIICTDCVEAVAKKHDLNITMDVMSNINDVSFTMIDSNSKFLGFDYEWKFIIRYAFPSCSTSSNCLEALQK